MFFFGNVPFYRYELAYTHSHIVPPRFSCMVNAPFEKFTLKNTHGFLVPNIAFMRDKTG
jgi:hypothetical protein